jgi:hypothetical protein
MSLTPRRALATLSAVAAVLLVAGHALAAPSSAQVRECVERNLPRYSNPGSAVVAQYSDVETACRALLEDGDVTVEFEPSGGEDRTGAAVGRDGGAGGGTGSADGAPASSATDAPDMPAGAGGEAETAPERPAVRRSETPGPEVAALDEDTEEGSGSPFPSTLTAGPPWMFGLLGVVGIAIAAAGAAAIRRRPR